ncbi:MAG TPA: TonB-dependent receptor [Puia sp.]|nr:TonB-dependent receptor [Puia sp.]
MKRILLSGLFCCVSLITFAQNKFTITGYVKDSLSGETLIGATVSINGKNNGIASNQYGFFSITLPANNYVFSCTYVGYDSKQINISLQKNIEFNFLLSPKVSTNKEVIISSVRKDANVKNAQMGRVSLSMDQVKSLPVIFGEVDILKTLQLLPGVQNAGEGNIGLYVRGGGPDQNLILLDDAIVYNTGHLFGFFSIFNSDAIKNTTLIKGGMPAQYGGRLSSVLDVAMKEGNINKFQMDGGIGIISSRFSLQGPIKKNKASFIISARRTYIDVLTKPFIPNSSNYYGSGYYFYDLNTKVNYQFSEKDRLYLSGYFGRDVFNFNNAQRSFKANIPWGNATATLRWNHVFNRKLFANTTLVYNDYKFGFDASQQDFQIQLSSGIHDLTAKTDLDYFLTPQHKIKFGGQFTYHTFSPNILSGRSDTTIFVPNNSNKKYANEAAIYVQDDWTISDKLQANVGLRLSGFSQIGPYTIYKTDSNGNRLDSTVYKRGQSVKTYGGLEPRFTLRYSLNDETSLKASVVHNLQYIHLVSNSGTTLPTDLWVPSTYRVKPQIGWQYSAGVFKNFEENTYETSVELYYKTMQNQIEYGAGYTPSLQDPEQSFVFGKGWSYGAEFYVNKARGRLTGWIGYTLSWTWRQFPQLNNGEKYPAKYDRRHDLNIVAAYELNKHWKLSAVFVFATGNATTLPTQFYIVEGVLTQEYSKINQYRLPNYHRLDLAATYTPTFKPNKKIHGSWVFSIYNVYNHLNPYFIYFDQTGNPYNGTLKVSARQVSLFPVIPSVTWNFHF